MPFLNIKQAIYQGTELLEKVGVAAPRLTAEVLLGYAIGRERAYLYAHPEQELREVEWIHFGRYLHERASGKPTQYITHKQEFYGREFRVTPDVLIPRPETEHVVEAALALPAERIVDVGCGSGAIAVTLAAERDANVVATDLSAPAIAVAAENARKLNARVQFVQCDLLSAIADASMDLVVSNPPYISRNQRDTLQPEVRDWEPELALFGGATGTEIYARLLSDSRRVLKPRGWLVLELGFDSLPLITPMLSDWRDTRTIPDLAGIPRVLVCQWAV